MEVYLIISPCCCISILCDSFIIITFARYKEIKETYEYQLIVIFSIFDALQSASTILPILSFKSITLLCTIQGILIQISSLANILWTGFIATAMFYEIVLERQRFRFIIPLFIILSLSIISAILPLFYNAYALSGG